MRMITTPPPFAPAISVAIPMYNTEKYIGALLESLLAQTFQNFEVIVVDDCSTDKSCAVVESYMQKFGGQLKLSQMQKNSGGPGAPSNKAVALSRGKYVYVIDNDDLLVNNALEILYNYAEKFNADVVHMYRYLEFVPVNDNIFPSQQELKVKGNPLIVTEKPILITEDKAERLKKCCNVVYYWPAWHKFVKRDFLIDNNIVFPDLKFSQDLAWTVQVIFHAERLLIIPEPLYIYRIWANSIVHKKRTPEELINFRADMLIDSINFFDDWANKQKFFQDNLQFKWMILDLIAADYTVSISGTVSSIPKGEYFKLIESKLKKVFGESASVTAYCFASLLLSKMQVSELAQNLNQLINTVKILQAN